MEEPTVNFQQMTRTGKNLLRRLLIIGENRLELLAVEVQEERERLWTNLLMALGVAVCALLAVLALTAALVVWLWACSPGLVLLALAVLYGLAGWGLSWRLARRRRKEQMLAATLDELRKDCAGLEKILE